MHIFVVSPVSYCIGGFALNINSELKQMSTCLKSQNTQHKTKCLFKMTRGYVRALSV